MRARPLRKLLSMKTRQPIYRYGDPQWRVFLPKHTIIMLNPEHFEEKVPNNFTFFEVEMSMTEFELKDYLKNVYRVPIADIVMDVLPPVVGRDHLGRVYVEKPERKLARVLLQRGWTFKFPPIFEKTADKEQQEKYRKETLDKQLEKAKKDLGMV